MRECANFCENRLRFYLKADNAPLGPTLSFLPMFGSRSVKTERIHTVVSQTKVKTDADQKTPPSALSARSAAIAP